MKNSQEKMKKQLLWVLIVLLILWSAVGTNFNPLLFKDFGNTLQFLRESFLNPDWSTLPVSAKQATITIQIAIMGTFLSLLFAFPLSFLAAKNISPNFFWYNSVRSILTFLRSVPEIVFALLFVPTVSLGPFAGVLALMLHNIGVLGKLISEIIETSDIGPQEAVASTGAGKLSVICFGILPQINPIILSNIFYRLEVSVRESLVLGLVGAGGVGQLLSIHFKVFEYNKVAVDILVIMVMVGIIDYIGSYVRQKVI